MKSGSRFLGVDDSSHEKFEDEKTSLIGVTYRGAEFIEDVRKVEVKIDGGDATEKIIELYNNAEASEIAAVVLDGISFAGLNVVDLEKLSGEIEVPVVAVTTSRPDREKFYEALKIVGNEEGFWSLEDPVELELEEGKVFLQFAGCTEKEAKEIVQKSTLQGLTPECVRVADMIGRIV